MPQPEGMRGSDDDPLGEFPGHGVQRVAISTHSLYPYPQELYSATVMRAHSIAVP